MNTNLLPTERPNLIGYAKTIHMILEPHDSGSPNLYAYRRVIIHVK